MNNVVLESDIQIENMIYEIRGKQVMLASDVARLYMVETKRINEVIKRNIERFPEDFCFQLVMNEYLILRSQIATSSEEINERNFIYNDSFHDRYFILDKSIVYHCGTSLNYIGKKTFSINKIEDDFVIESLIEKVDIILIN